MKETSEIVLNVSLSKKELKRVKSQVIEKGNSVAAAKKMGISDPTFRKFIKGETTVSTDKKDALLALCDEIEGKQSN